MLLLVVRISGGVQWSLLTFIFMSNSVTLFLIRPYTSLIEGVPDYMNNIIILIFATFQAGMLSQWISDAERRYLNGIYFDVFLGICMISNFGFALMASSGTLLVLKLKRTFLRRRNRKEIA